MSFLQRFQHTLDLLLPSESPHAIVIAYSGGLDSHVLLHACHQLNLPLRVIHIHHGLQAQADSWVRHCQQVCDGLLLALEIIYVDARPAGGQSPEEAARIARYRALKQSMANGDYLLTAQHADDQVETLLLQLLRGAGAAGLAAMPEMRQLGPVKQLRPLLNFTRAEIKAYAQQEKLHWIEDPSNNDSRYNRNYIRHHIIPLIKQRWPAYTASFSAAAKHQQANLELIESLAAIDLASLSTVQSHVLLIPRLTFLSAARQKNALRYWLKHIHNIKPGASVLDEIVQSVVAASEDAKPLLKWAGYEIRRYRDKLYLLPQAHSQAPVFDATETFWQPASPLNISMAGCQLVSRDLNCCHSDKQPGLKPALKQSRLRVGFRQGGERIQPAGKQHSLSLKALFQYAGVPPWQRQQVPLIYLEDELIAVAGICLADAYCVNNEEPGWCIDVQSTA